MNTNEDMIEFKQRLSENIFPTLTIGSQQLKGFNDAEWSTYLNAAGYPQKSALPRNYTNPAPTPLVAAKRQPKNLAHQQHRSHPKNNLHLLGRLTPATQPASSFKAGLYLF